MSDSPSQYVEDLQTQNRALRASLVEAIRDNQELQTSLTQLTFAVLKLRNDVISYKHRLGID